MYRKHSKKQPSFDDATINWEETVYLNIIMHQVSYLQHWYMLYLFCIKVHVYVHCIIMPFSMCSNLLYNYHSCSFLYSKSWHKVKLYYYGKTTGTHITKEVMVQALNQLSSLLIKYIYIHIMLLFCSFTTLWHVLFAPEQQKNIFKYLKNTHR